MIGGKNMGSKWMREIMGHRPPAWQRAAKPAWRRAPISQREKLSPGSARCISGCLVHWDR